MISPSFRSWFAVLVALTVTGAKLIAHNCNINLFDQCFSHRPLPFEIDANSGAKAGIAEMLLQSHDGHTAPLVGLRMLGSP